MALRTTLVHATDDDEYVYNKTGLVFGSPYSCSIYMYTVREFVKGRSLLQIANIGITFIRLKRILSNILSGGINSVPHSYWLNTL